MKRAIFTTLLALSAVDEKYGVTETITEFRDRIGSAVDGFNDPEKSKVPHGYILVPTELPDSIARDLVGGTSTDPEIAKRSYAALIQQVSGE